MLVKISKNNHIKLYIVADVVAVLWSCGRIYYDDVSE